ncbi:MAG: UDP-N-acetylglucosamine 2-epimerase (non-hydrolyzing) [Ignavibacteriaceae bacterium]|jgi:UDP-N-acetylglucosamine 2-epimerase
MAKKKILSIVGARPQIIKSSPVSKVLRKSFCEILLHTGQHYDKRMSQVFFDLLHIPQPDYNLNVGSASHAMQTAKMMIGIEEVIVKEKPDMVLVYGDTNSTLAGAVTAAKMHIPVIHIEAGLRSYNKKMPEELNRVCTDHLSNILFCPSKNAADNLIKEGIKNNVFVVGDVMKDAVAQNINHINTEEILSHYKVENDFYFMTIHRQENTDDPGRLKNIVALIKHAQNKVYFSLHPRTKKLLSENKINLPSNVVSLEPVNYMESLSFQKHARIVITDSGGIQKEAFYLNTPCITLRDETEWIETVQFGFNKVIGVSESKFKEVEKKFLSHNINFSANNIYGDGNASGKIVEILRNFYA